MTAAGVHLSVPWLLAAGVGFAAGWLAHIWRLRRARRVNLRPPYTLPPHRSPRVRW